MKKCKISFPGKKFLHRSHLPFNVFFFFLIFHNNTPISAYNLALRGRKSWWPHTLKISQSEGSERQKTHKILDNWNNHDFSRSQGLAKNFGATSGHAFVKSVCPDALARAFQSSQQHRMLGIWYEKKKTRFKSCLMPPNPSASGNSAEAVVPDRRQHGWGSSTTPIFCIVWGLLCCKIWHWQKLYYRSMRQRLQFYRQPLLLSVIWHQLQLLALFSASQTVFELWHCLMFHLSTTQVSSLVSWTVLRAGIIMMLLSPSFSCRRALKDWKGAKFLPGKSCWFVLVILWLYEWVNPKLKIHILDMCTKVKVWKFSCT